MGRWMWLLLGVSCGGSEDVCASFCGLAGSCGSENAGEGCVVACDHDLEGAYDFDAGCGRALERRYDCVVALTCEGFDDWLRGEPPEAFPCEPEELATDRACGLAGR